MACAWVRVFAKKWDSWKQFKEIKLRDFAFAQIVNRFVREVDNWVTKCSETSTYLQRTRREV
jgi:hypothetical protein